ncbi:class I glutamine amidotransferase-like protein [Thelonectria olida]|uniref:Class I glutamine amidotransferase-like protein n=1 Tax=Thelonectria olida TaxID=1576542 RepID=A0A9P9APD0_9HYPO|nr:class I glutamine amidotransferase-like protein [Thelonectria olida]
MIISERVISVAVFKCGYTCPSIQHERGQFEDIFASLLEPAAERVCTKTTKVKLNITGWDTVDQVYPPTLDGIDAIIVSGSPNGAYEDLEWIRALNAYLSYVYHHHPFVKLYGSCFGHQVICRALFSDKGAVVERGPSRWELGVHSITLADQFAGRFSTLLQSRSLRLQFLHGDHVVLQQQQLPQNIHIIGFTTQCQVQGIYQPGRILTYQGHPEFDQFISIECLKLVGQHVAWDAAFLDSAIAAAGKGDDAAIATDTILAFFLEPELTNYTN